MENNLFEDMPEALRGTALAAGVATFLTLAIHKDQITQPIEDRLPEAVREAVLVTGAAIFLSLAILENQDLIMEMSGQVTQAIKDSSGATSRKILDFLDDVKEKVMSLPSAFWTTDVQDNEASTQEISTRSMADRIKDVFLIMGNTEQVSGE